MRKKKKTDLYEILGVAKDCTDPDIKKAWKRKSLTLHPDRMVGKTRAEKIIADKQLRDVNEAHDVLIDKNKRAAYDSNGFDEHGNVQEGHSFGHGGGGMHGMDISDLIGSMFGGGGGSNVQFSFGGPGGSRRRSSGSGGGSSF